MRVLIILKYIPSASTDRKTDSLFATVRAHEYGGHSVILLTSGRAEPCEWKVLYRPFSFHERCIIWLLSRFSIPLSIRYRERNIVQLVIQENRIKPIDLMLAVCTGNSPGIHAQAIKAATGIPYVIREHKIYERTINSLKDIEADYLIALREADAVVAVSPNLANIMMELGIRDDIGVIPNALPDEFFNFPEDMKDTLKTSIKKWGDGGFIFGGWTRWRPFKRIDLLLEAFVGVRRRVPNAKLFIAGSIEPESNDAWARSFIVENSIEDSVWVFGVADRQQIHQIAYAIDCGVISSDYETFGLPALEAMAGGKPVVTTQCNGPEYIVNSEEFGIVVERGNAISLENAMVEVYERYNMFDPEKIRTKTYQRFSHTSMSKEFNDLYQKIFSRAK